MQLQLHCNSLQQSRCRLASSHYFCCRKACCALNHEYKTPLKTVGAGVCLLMQLTYVRKDTHMLYSVP